ncbi:MAG: putative lipid II flippase FtsW [Deltaproteobacteria bacterium]|nr:putative lipid II flippase FtsW [Deltaproteobacteria bacterium]
MTVIRADGPGTSRLDRVRAVFRVPGPVDPMIAVMVVTLVAFGVVMVYSASAIEATVQYKDPQYFLKRQVSFGVVGLLMAWGISRIDYHAYKKLTYPILAGVVFLLIAAVAGLGKKGGGATRWIALGPVHIQPAELAKLALIIWLAYSLAKKGEGVKTFSIGFLPHLLMSGFLMLLCLKQPDFGSAVVLLLLTFTMLFVAGAKVGYILGALILGSIGGAAIVRFKEYRWQRVVAWLEMEAHRQDLAYQPFQARMSFGSGSVFGLGLGKGLQILYLPEAHTDFVGAIVGEELGFVGVAALCLAYVALVARGVRAAFRAPDDYGTYLAFGLSTLFALQALINLAVAMSLLPTKGLTLPFISYGGSSLLVNAMAAGILLNVSRHSEAHAQARAEEHGPVRAEEAVA